MMTMSGLQNEIDLFEREHGTRPFAIRLSKRDFDRYKSLLFEQAWWAPASEPFLSQKYFFNGIEVVCAGVGTWVYAVPE